MKHLKKYNESYNQKEFLEHIKMCFIEFSDEDKYLKKKNKSIMDLVSKLKSFESFSMYRENCDRCGESTNNSTTMSVFNEDVICMSCKAKEKEDPDYDAAVEAEMAALKRGDSNYKGAIPNYKPIKR